MQAVNLNDLRLLRVEHAPYELYKPGPKPCEFFIKVRADWNCSEVDLLQRSRLLAA